MAETSSRTAETSGEVSRVGGHLEEDLDQGGVELPAEVGEELPTMTSSNREMPIGGQDPVAAMEVDPTLEVS